MFRCLVTVKPFMYPLRFVASLSPLVPLTERDSAFD